MSNIGIYGLGGFAKEIYSLIKDDCDNLVCVYDIEDNNYYKWKDKTKITTWNNFKILKKKKVVIAISNPIIRKKIYNKIQEENIDFFEVRAKNALKIGDVAIGECSIICPFTTLTTDIVIGKGFHCNIYSYVGHDCKIGDFVTFAPSVKCNGNVTIENNVYIGTGTVIKQGSLDKPLIIGENSIISAGTYINKNVPPNHLVYGNPCKFIKKNEK